MEKIIARVSIMPKGEYVALNYQRLDLVTYNGSAYLSLEDNNATLPTDDTKWMFLVASTSPFRGGLVIADVPTLEGTYNPTEEGIYTNAGGLIYDASEGYTEFMFDGTIWTKRVIPTPFSLSQDIEPLNTTNAVTGKAVAGYVAEKANDLFREYSLYKYPLANLPVRRYTAVGTFNDYALGYSQSAVSDGLDVSIVTSGSATVRHFLRTSITGTEAKITETFKIKDFTISSGGVGIGYLEGSIYRGYVYLSAGQFRKINGFQTDLAVTGLPTYTVLDTVKVEVFNNEISFYINDVLAYSTTLIETEFKTEILICQTGFIRYITKTEINQDPIRDYVDITVENTTAPLEAEIQSLNAKLDFTRPSNNLIDKSKVVYGYWSDTGVATASANSIRTPKTPIDSSKLKISLNENNLIGVPRFLFWDADNILISTVPREDPVENVSIPTNAEYVAVNIVSITGGVGDSTDNPYVNNLILNYGEVALPYESYGDKIKDSALPDNLGASLPISVTGISATEFVVNSRHDNGEIVQHFWIKITHDVDSYFGWYPNDIKHKGNRVVQGSFNWIHMTMFPNESVHVGMGHGCEKQFKMDFYIDGKIFVPADNIGSTLEGGVFSFNIEADVFAGDATATGGASLTIPISPLTLSMKHYMNGYIAGNSKTRNDNKLVVMRNSTSFSRCYLGMHLGFKDYFDRLQVHNVENTMNECQTFTPIAPSTAVLQGDVYDTSDGFRGELAHAVTSYSDRFNYVFKTECYASVPEQQKKMFVQVANTAKCYFHPINVAIVATPRGLTIDSFNKGDIIEGTVYRQLIV